QGRKTVFDVLGPAADGLIAIGRLDLATAGLLLLTTDTQLAERLTNPDNAVVRRYAVTVRGEVRDEDCLALERGIGELSAVRVVVRKHSRRGAAPVRRLERGPQPP